MKTWKQGVSYVYYIPELDDLYVARVVSANKNQIVTSRSHGLIIDGGKTKRINFNPDVVLLINHKTGRVKKFKTVFIGVLK